MTYRHEHELGFRVAKLLNDSELIMLRRLGNNLSDFECCLSEETTEISAAAVTVIEYYRFSEYIDKDWLPVIYEVWYKFSSVKNRFEATVMGRYIMDTKGQESWMKK